MFSLTPLVTSLALLVHVLAGCCWHHAHATPAVGMAMGVHTCAHHEIGHDSDESHDESSHSDHDSPCDEGRCVVIQWTSTAVTAPWDLPLVAGAGLQDSQIGESPVAWIATSSENLAALHASQTPVTLHQLLRI